MSKFIPILSYYHQWSSIVGCDAIMALSWYKSIQCHIDVIPCLRTATPGTIFSAITHDIKLLHYTMMLSTLYCFLPCSCFISMRSTTTTTSSTVIWPKLGGGGVKSQDLGCDLYHDTPWLTMVATMIDNTMVHNG